MVAARCPTIDWGELIEAHGDRDVLHASRDGERMALLWLLRFNASAVEPVLWQVRDAVAHSYGLPADAITLACAPPGLRAVSRDADLPSGG